MLDILHLKKGQKKAEEATKEQQYWKTCIAKVHTPIYGHEKEIIRKNKRNHK